MTIRPLDMQVLIPRVTEVGKAQQNVHQQETQQQQQFPDQWQHISAKRQQQVQSSNKSAETKVKRENQQESKQQQREKQGKGPGKDRGESDVHKHTVHDDPMRGNLIDIKT